MLVTIVLFARFPTLFHSAQHCYKHKSEWRVSRKFAPLGRPMKYKAWTPQASDSLSRGFWSQLYTKKTESALSTHLTGDLPSSQDGESISSTVAPAHGASRRE